MPPEAVLDHGQAAFARDAVPADWRRALVVLGLTWAALILAFADDWQRMADQWWNSSTYNHILVIPAILLWLVHVRWPQLARLRPQPWWPPLVLIALIVFGWVLGSFAGFDLLRQAAAVALLPASALAILGPLCGAALSFPLVYMVFLVPFGDELIPVLQTVTAKITIALVGLSGVPARIDGVFIDTPAGLFEVAEACSGVKFLIAMLALGVLVANVCFLAWRRRLTFLSACLVVPILANGVRAWGTIMAAQYVGVERAAGIDHIIYGWVFFAVVIAAVLGLAWRFFERPVDDPMIDAEAIAQHPGLCRLARYRQPLAIAISLIAALVGAGLAWGVAGRNLTAPVPSQITLPQVPGWQQIDYHPLADWQPRAAGADHRLLARYRDREGNMVDLFLAVYASQGEGKEAGAYGEGALPPGGDWAWQGVGPAMAGQPSERLLAKGQTLRLAQTWYRSGPVLTTSAARLKLAVMRDRLLLRPRVTAVLILSAEAGANPDPAQAIIAFHRTVGPLDAWIDRAALVR